MCVAMNNACCSVLQCVAVTTVLQCAAVLQCYMYMDAAASWPDPTSIYGTETQDDLEPFCISTQCVAVCCSVLQCVVVHYLYQLDL